MPGYVFNSAALISGLFEALIDDDITLNASIKKAKILEVKKGLSSSTFPVESNERGSDFPLNKYGADFVPRNHFRIVEIYL